LEKGVAVYDILLKDGQIIDPSQGMNKRCSLAIRGGKIATLAEKIDESAAQEVFDLEGKIITPGLIDLHCHPVAEFWSKGVPADEAGLDTGVTHLCDAGSSGSANFKALRKLVIDQALTEITCFLNFSKTGFLRTPEIVTEYDISLHETKEVVEANRAIIKGIKIRAIQALADSLGMRGIEMAKRLAADLNVPLMLHIGETRRRVPNDPMGEFSRGAVSILDQGDILSHYLTWEPGGMILEGGTVYPELERAMERGVILDSCHGLNHFSFRIARYAIARGIIPTVISTDLSLVDLRVVQSLPVVMSKFLNLGLSLDQVVEMTTANPAKALGEENRMGCLKVGREANLTVLELTRGHYLFGDGTGGNSMKGEILLEPRIVFKNGKPIPAYSRYQVPSKSGPCSEASS